MCSIAYQSFRIWLLLESTISASSFNKSSSSSSFNSALNKDLVEVAGFKKTTKNYARTFQPTMTREEYSINQLRQEQRNTSRTLSRLFKREFSKKWTELAFHVISSETPTISEDVRGFSSSHNTSNICFSLLVIFGIFLFMIYPFSSLFNTKYII